jgi:hypothetical protein
MELYKSVLISIVIIVLSSCSSATNLAEQSSIPTPDIGIEVQNQKYLQVTAPDGWNSFKTGKPVSLLIINISDTQIVSDPDLAARIFVRTDDEWLEVTNKTVSLNGPIALEPNKNFDATKTVSLLLLPDLPNDSVTSDVRIFVVGTLIENGKESKKVASYIDLRLNP